MLHFLLNEQKRQLQRHWFSLVTHIWSEFATSMKGDQVFNVKYGWEVKLYMHWLSLTRDLWHICKLINWRGKNIVKYSITLHYYFKIVWLRKWNIIDLKLIWWDPIEMTALNMQGSPEPLQSQWMSRHSCHERQPFPLGNEYGFRLPITPTIGEGGNSKNLPHVRLLHIHPILLIVCPFEIFDPKLGGNLPTNRNLRTPHNN